MNEEELISTVLDGRDPSVGPGAAIGSFRKGLRRTATAGNADVENVVAVSEGTIFHVASLAKQFTAFLVATLAAEGRLDLDCPVGDILGWLRPPASLCTVRQLVLHTGGVRDHWALSEFAGLRDGDSITTADACGWIDAQTELNFVPGTRFLYSNSGYVLLARVVETLEGASFVEIAERRIFRPLDMTSTFFVDRPDKTFPRRARGYRQEGGEWVRCEPNYGVVGATCLRTNVPDMLTWLSTPLEAPFFAQVSKVGYFEPGTLHDGSPIRYGFGQIHTTLGGRKVILHGGFDYGFNAIALRDPVTGDALFAASNGSTPAIEGAAMSWFGNWDPVREPDEAGASARRVRGREGGRPLPGVYVREDMTDLRVISETGEKLKIFWNQEMDLELTQAGTWAVVGTPVVARTDGDVLVFSNGLEEVRLAPVPSEPFEAAQIAGDYICDDLGSLMRIGTEDGRATLRIGRGAAHEVTAVNPRLLRFGANWMTVERHAGRVTGLRLFHMRCAGVRFRPLES